MRGPRARLFVPLAVVGTLVLVGAVVLALVGFRPAPRDDDLPWPAQRATAVGIGDDDVLGPEATDPRPLGALPHLVTTLVVVETSGVSASSPGRAFLLGQADDEITRQTRRDGGTVVDLPAGTPVTERLLLESMLIAGADNHARSLAQAVSHNLGTIMVADATGLSSQTRGSAAALLTVSRLALAAPVLATIAGTASFRTPSSSATDPLTVMKTNGLRGRFGVDGLTEGTTNSTGFVIAAPAPVDGTAG